MHLIKEITKKFNFFKETERSQNLEELEEYLLSNNEATISDCLLYFQKKKNLFQLSEISFFLRFYWRLNSLPNQSKFLAIPKRGSEEYEVYQLMKEVFIEAEDENYQQKAWEYAMQNKLWDITACGHYCDTLFWNIFFSSKKDSKKAIKVTEELIFNSNEEDKSITIDVLQSILENYPEKSFVARLETNEHVFTLDFPALKDSEETRNYFQIESSLHLYDSFVQTIDWKHVEKFLQRAKIYSFAEYQHFDSINRLKEVVKTCYAEDQLNSVLSVYNTKLTWNQILDCIVKMNQITRKMEDPYSFYQDLIPKFMKIVNDC